jgi:outer membrane protein
VLALVKLLFLWWVSLIAVSTLSFSASSAVRPLNLKEAVDFALLHSPVFNSAKKSQVINELQYKTVYAKLFPSLDFSTTNGLENNIPFTDSANSSEIITTNPTAPWYSSVNLGLTENLYDNGVTSTNIDIASLNKEVANINYKKTRDTLTLNVASEFYHYSLLATLFEVHEQQQVLLNKQFKMLTSLYLQGFKPKSDYLRLKIQVQQAEIDKISADSDRTQSRLNLLKILGVGEDSKETPSFIPIASNRNENLQSRFPSQAPPVSGFYDYRLTKVQEEVNEKNVVLVEKNYWPQILLTSGVAYSNLNYINSPVSYASGNQLSWNALVTLNYNFWDWGSRKRDVEVAQLNRDIQKNSLDQNLISVNASIAAMMANLASVAQTYSLNQELLTLQEESNHEVEVQYREGKATYLDLISSLNNLLAVRLQFYTSYFNALTGMAQYKYYEGKIYDSLVEE